jgi:hypothetical protein
MKRSSLACGASLLLAVALACSKSGDDQPRSHSEAGATGAAATGGSGTGGTAGKGGTSGGSNGGASAARGGAGGNGGAGGTSGAGEGGVSTPAAGGNGGTSGTAGTGAMSGSGGAPGDLGEFPVAPSPVTRGGTMTFTNVGAEGSWPRRLDREPGDPDCDYKDGTDTWGGHCCMTEHTTQSTALSPFDEEMTLILKALDVKQLAVYQPGSDAADAPYERVTSYDARTSTENLWFTQAGDGSPTFPGDLTSNDCVGYVMQEPVSDCNAGAYYCPEDPGVLHRGFAGSKLVVFLASMSFDDAGVTACDGDGAGHPGPWVAFVASELVRDGGRKWNGLCNCYSKTGSVGDGCGEINVFEVVMDNNDFSNREFASTGVRSFQEGHVGGAVCQASCDRDAFADDVDVVDACAAQAYETGPELAVGGETDGCPVWRRPNGDRYFFILLDKVDRVIQVGMIHPSNIPQGAAPLLPALPATLQRAAIDALADLRLPG